MDEYQEHEFGGEKELIKLDGSIGIGPNALVTIITHSDIEGEKEETFLMPYALLNFEQLQKFLTVHFINGVKILHQPSKVEK